MANQQNESLSYDELTRIIGSLYLETERRQKSLQEQAKTVIEELQNKVSALETEIELLKSSSENSTTEEIQLGILGNTEEEDSSNGAVQMRVSVK